MPTITLQDGTKVIISQESYDALSEAVKPKELTYNDVAIELFKDKKVYYLSLGSSIVSCFLKNSKNPCIFDADNAPTKNQLKQLFALNKLFNVAYFLNEGWVPNWKLGKENKYFIGLQHGSLVMGARVYRALPGVPYFKSEELARRAIVILGEKAIKECFGIFE